MICFKYVVSGYPAIHSNFVRHGRNLKIYKRRPRPSSYRPWGACGLPCKGMVRYVASECSRMRKPHIFILQNDHSWQ